VVALRGKLLHMLASGQRSQFLASLADALPLAARGEYAEAGHSSEHALASLRAVNEMMIVIGAQLVSSLNRQPSAYPDEAFLDVLLENAVIGDCRHVLAWALQRAVSKVENAAEC
jgi:hypothetical protein